MKKTKDEKLYILQKISNYESNLALTHKIKDLFGSEGIQKKQPSRSVLRKRCSENMQPIYRITSMSKCEFNKLHFGMGVLLYVKFAACLFSEHIFLKPPQDAFF